MSGGLKIALVIERMDPQRGGRERSVAEIAAGLARRGHGVSVLCRSGSLDSPGVEVVALGSAGATRAGRARSFAKAVTEAARREAYDVLHATLPVPGANVYQPRGGTIPALLAAKARRAGALGRLWQRIALPLNRARRLAWKFEKRIVADPGVACLAVSQLVAEEFALYYGRRENVHVVYGGVAVPCVDAEGRASWRAQWRRRWGAADEDVVFVCAATNFELKGVGETVEAFAEFCTARTGAWLVIVGGGSAGPHRRAAERLGVGERVLFEEPVANVFPLYSAADAVVLLSWQDACSRVVLEALRWGLPSLTTRYNGAAELLARGAGKVVESPRDRAAVVAALAELADPARRAVMADACRAEADFACNERQVDELERIYREVAAT